MRPTSLARWLVTAWLLSAATGCASSMQLQLRSPSQARTVAAQRFDEGVQAYGRGEMARALTAFTAAHEAAPSDETLFNLARVHDAMDHAPQAIRLYVEYLRGARGVSPGLRAEIDASIGRLRRRVAWVLVRAREGVVIDGEAVRPEQTDVPFAVWPGARAVRVAGRGEVRVQARLGETVVVDFEQPGVLVSVTNEPGPELNGLRPVQVRSAEQRAGEVRMDQI